MPSPLSAPRPPGARRLLGSRAGKAKKALLGVLAVLGAGAVCCAGSAGAGIYGFFEVQAQAEPVVEGMALLSSDAEVVRRIGEPIERQWYFTFEASSSNGTGSGRWEIPVEGPLGSGTLALTASMEGGEWSLATARFLDPVTEDQVDLLGRVEQAEQVAQGSQVDVRFEAARAAEEAGRTADALDGYDAVILEQPGHAEARLARGRLRREAGQLTEAEADLTMATKTAETAEGAWRELGLIHHDRGEWQACVDAYTEVLKKYADDGGAWYGRARCYEQLGDTRKALAGAREACSYAVVQACEMVDRL